MLENATRICEAQFGNLWLVEGAGLRSVAMHNLSIDDQTFGQNQQILGRRSGHPKGAQSGRPYRTSNARPRRNGTDAGIRTDEALDRLVAATVEGGID